MSDKSYVGYCTSFRFKGGGEIVKMALNEDDLNTLRDNVGGDGRVRVCITQMREPKGNRTHSCYLDTWKPTRQAEPTAELPDVLPNEQGDAKDTMPF